MNIKIYQINIDRDKNKVAFLSFDSMMRKTGTNSVNSNIYDCVFTGTLHDIYDLEDIFSLFNSTLITQSNHMRSLSVSDVVYIENSIKLDAGYYYCDSFGFAKVIFQETKIHLPHNHMSEVKPGITVLKHGDPKCIQQIGNNSYKFACQYCGCEFEADQKSVTSIYTWNMCRCPECSMWVTE